MSRFQYVFNYRTLKIFKEIHGEPIKHTLILADYYKETKVADKIGISMEDGSISILLFDSIDEYEKHLNLILK